MRSQLPPPEQPGGLACKSLQLEAVAVQIALPGLTPASACTPRPCSRSYEGRCSLPSNFDATYCNALGQAAGALVATGQTGVMASVANLQAPAHDWSVGGTPLLSMMHMERRAGR